MSACVFFSYVSLFPLMVRGLLPLAARTRLQTVWHLRPHSSARTSHVLTPRCILTSSVQHQLWFLLRSWGVPMDLLLMVTLYGYSLFIFIPISARSPFRHVTRALNPRVNCPSFHHALDIHASLRLRAPAQGSGGSLNHHLCAQILSVIPVDAVRWPINMAGGLISTACLVFNLRALLEPLQDGKRRTIVLGVCGASQIGACDGMRARAPPTSLLDLFFSVHFAPCACAANVSTGLIS